MRKQKTLIIALLVTILASGMIGYRIYANVNANKERASKMAQTKAVTVEVAQVGRRDITPNLSVSANLEPVWSAEVSAKVDGRINSLNVSEGDVVKAGQVIAVLDSAELEAQVAQAEGNLMVARSNLEQAELDYKRYQILADQGAISIQALENAKTKRDLAIGQIRAAEGNTVLLRERLNNANVVAPRNGVVTKRYVQGGTFTRAGTPIVAMADLSTILAKATVSESQVSELSMGSTVKVVVEAMGDQAFTGVVARISPVAALPARTFTAEITIPNQEGIIRGGMFAKVDIPTRTHQAVLVVPETALVLREDQKTVFVLTEGNKVQQRVLRLGGIEAGWAEVLSGINEGETILVAGQNKVRDGVEVSPVKAGER